MYLLLCRCKKAKEIWFNIVTQESHFIKIMNKVSNKALNTIK